MHLSHCLPRIALITAGRLQIYCDFYNFHMSHSNLTPHFLGFWAARKAKSSGIVKSLREFWWVMSKFLSRFSENDSHYFYLSNSSTIIAFFIPLHSECTIGRSFVKSSKSAFGMAVFPQNLHYLVLSLVSVPCDDKNTDIASGSKGQVVALVDSVSRSSNQPDLNLKSSGSHHHNYTMNWDLKASPFTILASDFSRHQ